MRITISLSLLFIAVAQIDPHSHHPLEKLSARSLDALLQVRAFEALSFRPRTGVIFDAEMPKSLAGVGVSALRLRSGNLRARGFERYKEFRIPVGLIEQPYAKRVVLVYHNLGNFSSTFYPLPGFDYLAPVLGLIAYDASNLTAVGLPELELRAWENPIVVRFGDVALPGSAKCVFFDLHGSVQFDKPTRGNACEMVQQGHLSVGVESTAPSPAPAPAAGDYYRHRRRVDKSKGWKIAGCLVVALVLLAGIGVFLSRVRDMRNANRDKEENEEWESRGGGGNALEMTSFGVVKAPFTKVTRTQPVLEDRYVT